MLYERYLGIIDEKSAEIGNISDYIWDHPETSYEEYSAVDMLASKLTENGFTVEVGVCGIPTAFTATFGEGHPHLGILAEYDGLSGMSQEACVSEKRPIEGKENNHSCGHNLFAAGSFGAALAVKEYVKDKGVGSITLFGCPAEEGGAGKVFMARDGLFNDVDAVVSWHPESMYMVRTRPALANVKVEYSFEGIAAHAGANPHQGRSALDALELMNVGVNFLREHMPLSARVHYAILDAGGYAPNMVQSHASVLYMIRDVDSESVRSLQARVDNIARGAALMTDTSVSMRVTSAYSSLITIPTLQAVANEAMNDIPVPTPTEEELEFGKALRESMPLTAAQKSEPIYADRVLPPAPPVAHGGSTDTADVSWNTPTVQMHIATWVKGTPGHSWHSEAQGKSTYAKKATLYAAKAVAATIMRLIDTPEHIEKAKAEHKAKIGDGYVCGIPEGVTAPIKPRK